MVIDDDSLVFLFLKWRTVLCVAIQWWLKLPCVLSCNGSSSCVKRKCLLLLLRLSVVVLFKGGDATRGSERYPTMRSIKSERCVCTISRGRHPRSTPGEQNYPAIVSWSLIERAKLTTLRLWEHGWIVALICDPSVSEQVLPYIRWVLFVTSQSCTIL